LLVVSVGTGILGKALWLADELASDTRKSKFAVPNHHLLTGHGEWFSNSEILPVISAERPSTF
jgi:hypothetical protein